MRFSAVLNKKIRRFMVGKFIDSAKVRVRGGNGADGLAKLGGVGGSGGDVVLQADAEESLDAFYKRWRRVPVVAAENGQPSARKRIFGHCGAASVLSVPIGVAAYRINDKGGGLMVGELNEIGERLVVAKGGAGGGPDNDFKGEKGEATFLQLDLKLIADCGLVGFPNAGKSTLLRAVSRAKPKVAAYPFTTVRPEVGFIEYPDKTKVSMADLPGLLEGAHLNRGMGHSFLRHIERTKLLVVVVDAEGFRLSPMHPERTCLQTVLLLARELELYEPTLLAKPALLVINKLDRPGALEVLENVRQQVDLQVADPEALLRDVPEEMRPSQPLIFRHVIGLSAHQGPEAVGHLKQLIKETLGEQIAQPDEDDYLISEKNN
ncbi:GTP-binding protein 10 homolog [Neocloeon triangulifer]|uniref:GTP-binding protein 10 homolog n=1 Tax=Neocloeon triangulifer TaxID=2078957 RepID=UPI00286F76B2|nr:GTP-binding protein 10 homolog [Neocloeon triangulifer]